jgi:hypothetical protein
MKFQVNGQGWPVGQSLVPAGTVIDHSASDDWSRVARAYVLPPNASPLDDEAYQAMKTNYSPHLLKFYGITDPGVRR